MNDFARRTDLDLDLDPEEPATKRRCCHPGSADPEDVYCGSFYFPDGDIVLETGTGYHRHRFKIHTESLKHSDIFADMFDIPQPPEALTIDGCPFVQLTDAPEDWAMALRWMYNPE